MIKARLALVYLQDISLTMETATAAGWSNYQTFETYFNSKILIQMVVQYLAIKFIKY